MILKEKIELEEKLLIVSYDDKRETITPERPVTSVTRLYSVHVIITIHYLYYITYSLYIIIIIGPYYWA